MTGLGLNLNLDPNLALAMSSEEDPLLALRQAVKAKDTITYSQNGDPCPNLLDATHIVVSPTCTLSKSAPTRYRKPGVSMVAGPDGFFSVEAVFLAWLLQSAPGADYMKQARENGLAVGFVSVTERKNVVDWLEGKITDHERIVPLVGTDMFLFGFPSLYIHCSRNYDPTRDTTLEFEGATADTTPVQHHSSSFAFEATLCC